MRRNEWHAEYLILRVSRNSLSHFPRLAPPLWRTPLQQPRSAVVFETPGTLRKSFGFFHLSWQMWKLNVMFLKVGDVACSSFHFRYNEHSRGFFQDVMLALRYSREQENSFCYSLSHVLKKKKKTSATCSGESVMHCRVASSLKWVVPYAPLNSYNI